MERVFIYEHLTGGGLLSVEERPSATASLLREGGAMLAALTADFVRAGFAVDVLHDDRLDRAAPAGARARRVRDRHQQQLAFSELAAAAARTVLIAPECDGILLRCCRWAEQCGARLLSPPSDFVAVAADKHRTAQRLAAGGVATPQAVEIPPGEPLPQQFAWPAVVKPHDGAGSIGLQHIADRRAAVQFPRMPHRLRLERFCPGLPASVAVLCGPTALALPAARQHLSGDGAYRYRGGSLPLEAALCCRARRLACRALAALPAAVGYVGIDLILGDAVDGNGDVVLEINPRLTTSYVGLRHLCPQNLAATMIAAADGHPVALSRRDVAVRFDTGGAVELFPLDRGA